MIGCRGPVQVCVRNDGAKLVERCTVELSTRHERDTRLSRSEGTTCDALDRDRLDPEEVVRFVSVVRQMTGARSRFATLRSALCPSWTGRGSVGSRGMATRGRRLHHPNVIGSPPGSLKARTRSARETCSLQPARRPDDRSGAEGECVAASPCEKSIPEREDTTV